MANVTIDALPANTPPLTGVEVVPISKAGVTEKATLADIKNYIKGTMGVHLATTAAAIAASVVGGNSVIGCNVAALGNIPVALPQASTMLGQTITFTRASALAILTDAFVLTAFAGDTIETPSTTGGLATVNTGTASYSIPRSFRLTSTGTVWIIS